MLWLGKAKTQRELSDLLAFSPFSSAPASSSLSSTVGMERTVSPGSQGLLCSTGCSKLSAGSLVCRALGKHLVVGSEVKTVVNLRFGQSLLIWLYATILGLGVSISINNWCLATFLLKPLTLNGTYIYIHIYTTYSYIPTYVYTLTYICIHIYNSTIYIIYI